jgi:hypothetical protein
MSSRTVLLVVGEGHLVERDCALRTGQLGCVLAILDVDREIHYAEDALRRGAGVLVAVDYVAHLGERVDQSLGQKQEDNECPDCQVTRQRTRRTVQNPDTAHDERRNKRE